MIHLTTKALWIYKAGLINTAYAVINTEIRFFADDMTQIEIKVKKIKRPQT